MANRVVVTGLGVVTPIGSGKDDFWRALLAGKIGIDRISRFDPEGFACQIAGEVRDFEPADYIGKKEARHMDRYSQFVVAAGDMAIKDAALDLDKVNKDRVGTYIGSGIGGIETMYDQYKKFFDRGPRVISPFFIPMEISNMGAAQVAIRYGFHGPSCCLVTACATGTDSIGGALRILQRGDADVMLAGGTEASISPTAVAGFGQMKALCTDHNDDPVHAVRPFDKNRSGFVMGEGAGIVVLETLDHALARGAHIYCELAGYGANSDAYHMTSPLPGGAYQQQCMELAVRDAGLTPDDIDYVNAHGTSTHMNDLGETEAIKGLFGARAHDVPVSSNKSMIGHLLGAAGGVEFVATALTVEQDMIPPTMNYETVDGDMDLDYVPGKSRQHKVRAAVSNSFGFGGHNACLVAKKFAE